MSDWRTLTIAEVARVDSSGAWGEEARGDGSDVSVLRTSDIDAGGNIKDTKLPRRFIPRNRERYLLAEGDIVVVKSSGSHTNVVTGKPCFVRKEHEGIAFTNFLLRLRPNREIIEPEFLYLYLWSPEVLHRIRGMVATTTYPNLRVPEYRRFLVPFPSLAQQRRVVSRINECLSRVEEMQRLRESALEEANRFFGAYIEDKYTALCRKFSTSPLSELVRVVGGGTPDRKSPEYWSGSIPWVSPKDMKRWEIDSAQESISPEALANSAAKLIESPAILFVVRGMILIHTLPVAISRVPLAINQDMKALIPNQKFSAEFLAYMFRGAARLLLDEVEVAGHGTRRLQTEKWISLPIPQVGKAQTSLVAEFDKVRQRAQELVSEWREDPSIALRESILREAFAGNL